MSSNNLRLRGQAFHFRRPIPLDLKSRFGQHEIVRSLGRATAGEARRLAHDLWNATEVLFMTVRCSNWRYGSSKRIKTA
jgi:hypothetical protein